ncbi:hypothetical protein [Scytonema sp. NUACC21]
MVLTPNVGGQEVVQRSNWSAPGNVMTSIEPLGMLVEEVGGFRPCFALPKNLSDCPNIIILLSVAVEVTLNRSQIPVQKDSTVDAAS